MINVHTEVFCDHCGHNLDDLDDVYCEECYKAESAKDKEIERLQRVIDKFRSYLSAELFAEVNANEGVGVNVERGVIGVLGVWKIVCRMIYVLGVRW